MVPVLLCAAHGARELDKATKQKTVLSAHHSAGASLGCPPRSICRGRYSLNEICMSVALSVREKPAWGAQLLLAEAGFWPTAAER